ncbi:MAG: hypothetical protein ACPGVD_06855 [Flavobacteriales bacterium]
MDKINTYKKEEIIKLISSKDINEFNKYCHEDVDEDDLLKLLKKEIKTESFSRKTVLGIDIYHYSQYKPLEQSLIPILFKLIYDQASELCSSSSSFLFQKYKSKDTFGKMFIDTGDGGFQIFDTPIHAVAFAVNFQMVVRYYNSFRYFPKLRKIVGPLSLRYAMTHDKIYKFDSNYFGPAIINNSRILIKDSLNRFLLDENTNNWLLYKINGIENLQNLSLIQLKELRCFADYKKVDGKNKIYSDTEGFNFGGITGCDIQKIGDITAKKTLLTIYNLHLQYSGMLGKDIYNTIITLGNLNTSGIS